MVFSVRSNISGTVMNRSGLGLAGSTVYFSSTPNASAHPVRSAVADPSGNYDMYVPLGDSGFDYANSDCSAFDPGSGTVLASEVVDLSMATTTTPVTIAPLQGTCSDNDIDNPDEDDPDCD